MQLHAALETSAGKRRAKTIIISTSASDDTHPFSQMLDNPPPRSFIIEHRAALGMPADDLDGLKAANPGSEHGIGPSLDWLQAQARVAIQRGGQALTGFRLYSLNQRVGGDGRCGGGLGTGRGRERPRPDPVRLRGADAGAGPHARELYSRSLPAGVTPPSYHQVQRVVKALAGTDRFLDASAAARGP